MTNSTDLSILEGRRTGPAIFAVELISSGKRLIIGTRNLSRRLCDQRRYLRRRRHYNPELQRELDLCGPNGFQLVVLELLDDVMAIPQRRRRHITEARKMSGCFNPKRAAHTDITLAPTVFSRLR